MKTLQKWNVGAGILIPLLLFISGCGVTGAQQSTSTTHIDPTQANIGLVTTYVDTHDTTMLAVDAQLYIAGRTSPLIGRDAIRDFLNVLYHSYGITRGVYTEPERIIPLSSDLILVEYTYNGNAFSGDYYPLESMIDSVAVINPLVSIFKIENDKIIREYLFEWSIPESVELNREYTFNAHIRSE